MLSLLQRHPLATVLSALAVVLALVIALEAGSPPR